MNDLAILTGALALLPDPIVLIDAERQVVGLNPAAAALLGSDAEGRDLALSLRHPAALEAVAEALAGGRPEAVEVISPVPVGQAFEALARRLEEPSGGFVLLALRDITLARGAERMRADFVANVSHELRSPLASLIGFIETLEGEARDDAEARERFLAIMGEEAGRMARLIDDLLSLSKVESGEHLRPEEEVAVEKLLATVCRTLGGRDRERRIELDLEIKSLAAVPGDADQLTEVFHNLIDNALKYGPCGRPVRIEAVTVDRIPELGGAGIRISVHNEGEGIEPQHLSRLTERFYRADKGRSRALGGTGLGLAIVKHIVNRHRGKLSIASRTGHGTTFTIYLPSIE